MADLKGTSQNDVVTVSPGDTYSGLDGDDTITLEASNKSGSAFVYGNQGNDKFICLGSVDENDPYGVGTVAYWDSRPSKIYVDLEAGYALDGWGTRDTFVNVHRVHGFSRDGDRGYGSSLADEFYIGTAYPNSIGYVFVDGKAGYDAVGLNLKPDSKTDYGNVVIVTASDGRSCKLWMSKSPQFIYELSSVERINAWNPQLKQGTNYFPSDFITFDTAGQDILLRGYTGLQYGRPGNAVSITYGFLRSIPSTGAEGGIGFGAFDATQQAAVRGVLFKLAQQTGINFVEADGGSAQMRFGINQQSNTRGYSFIPDEFKSDAKAGDVWLDVETAALLRPGQEGYYVLLHEIGHALGLQHPLSQSDTTGATVLLDKFVSYSNTIMMDGGQPALPGVWPAWFGALDMQALQYLYGRKSVATGDSRYTMGDVIEAGGALAILDTGGINIIDASGTQCGASLDIRPGRLSSMGTSLDGTPLVNNISICVGTTMTGAIGTGWDDLIVGNELNNRLMGNGGNDIIDGQGGTDVGVFAGARDRWQIDSGVGGSNYFVADKYGASGTTELRNVERVQFNDMAVALDLGKSDSAGQAVLLFSAVLGLPAVLSNRPLLGVGISLFDQGFTVKQLAATIMSLPIWGGLLTASDSATDIATYLLTVANGGVPSPAMVSAGASAISSQPAGEFLATLAMDNSNLARVDLVGLAKVGIAYVPA